MIRLVDLGPARNRFFIEAGKSHDGSSPPLRSEGGKGLSIIALPEERRRQNFGGDDSSLSASPVESNLDHFDLSPLVKGSGIFEPERHFRRHVLNLGQATRLGKFLLLFPRERIGWFGISMHRTITKKGQSYQFSCAIITWKKFFCQCRVSTRSPPVFSSLGSELHTKLGVGKRVSETVSLLQEDFYGR
jgi:hypothetical protein